MQTMGLYLLLELELNSNVEILSKTVSQITFGLKPWFLATV